MENIDNMVDYNFRVNEQEANLIIQALAELPAKLSMGLINKLQAQANEKTIIEEDDE